jgi:hypothetical protein
MPSWAGLQRDGSRYGLAILCIAGPMLVGTLAPDLALRALLPCAPKTLADLQSLDAWRACAPAAANFRLDLRPSAAVRSDRDTTAPSAATKSAQTADEIERLDPQHRDVLLGARDVEGRVRYVVASAFLFAARCGELTLESLELVDDSVWGWSAMGCLWLCVWHREAISDRGECQSSGAGEDGYNPGTEKGYGRAADDRNLHEHN